MKLNLRDLGREYATIMQQVAPVDMEGTVAVPDDFFQTILDYALERVYLEGLADVDRFPRLTGSHRSIAWVRIDRLPVHPSLVERYSLLPRWQSVLSTLHAWGHRLIFLLQRQGGQTHIYLGAISTTGLTDPVSAAAQLCQAATSQMPGMELRPVRPEQAVEEIMLPLTMLPAAGAITGLPSPRRAADTELLQTLDRLAFGIRDFAAEEHDYSLVVVADPVRDSQIAATIQTLRQVGSELHSQVKQSITSSESSSRMTSGGANLGLLAGALLQFVPGAPALLGTLAQYAGLSLNKTLGQVHGKSVGSEQLNKVAQYCEQLTDLHVERLKRGRNLGFWNAGIYVLAESETTVNTVNGILRSIYSGEDSYLEPIRVHLFSRHSGAAELIKQFQHIPFPTAVQPLANRSGAAPGGGWHPLGSIFESVTTPLNTEELSLATSLPRRDVPGLRFVRNAVRFATNPPQVGKSDDSISIGQVMDTGVALEMDYAFDINSLAKHALVTGVTGSGKSTTCRRLIAEMTKRQLPVLIIEPAKEEYVQWALRHNREHPEQPPIQVFMPGVEQVDGQPVQPLQLNPFQPAGAPGAALDFATRYERFSAVLTASLPMADVLPLLLEEAIYRYMQQNIDLHFADGDQAALDNYPRLEGLLETARRVVKSRGYEQRVQDNLSAAIETRLGALTRGKRGRILNVAQSTSWNSLFEQPAIVNLSQINDDRDKALIMALLLMSLFEYRLSVYRHDPAYRQAADNNQLRHLVVVEEAHRLLKNPEQDFSGIGNPQAVVSGMFSEMLSEIRAYGQGMMIVDQVPARLIPDAVKNTNCKIVHRLVARDDRAAVAACMALRPEQEEIIAVLPPGEAIICSDLDDAASWVRVRR